MKIKITRGTVVWVLDFGVIKAGDVGGYVEDDYAQATDDAQAIGSARVSGNAVVSGSARVFGNVVVSGNAQVGG